jgi:cyclopropane fatty-acyl-phospholipid synthase-like methyltransferase
MSGGRRLGKSISPTDPLNMSCPRPPSRRYVRSVADPFETVRTGYDRLGQRYRDLSRANPVRLRWIERLLAELRPDSVVVDLGCGAGEPATRMLAEEHRVCGVDASAVQLRLAQAAAPTALFIHADMTRFHLRPGSVDAVASFYALGHVPSHHHAPLISAISQWLHPGGVLLTSAPLAAGDQQHPDWLGTPMFFGGIGQPATRQALRDAGLSIESWEVVEEDEADGHMVQFVWLVARKQAVL